jgi:cell division protease FtsH
MTQTELENRIAVLLGGRMAEELVYNEVSTGAQDDLLKATDIARSMIKAYGMSPKFGQVSFERDTRSPFLQTGQPQPSGDYSELTAHDIDCEVRRIMDEQYDRVHEILETRREMLAEAAAFLLDKETMTGEELRAIAARATVTALEASVAEVIGS